MTRTAIHTGVLVVGLLVGGWVTTSRPVATAQSLQDGRYQLVDSDNQSVFLVDSDSGRVWRYLRLTDGDGEPVANNPCAVLTTCFYEIDRLELSADGWESEIVPGQP